MALCGDWDNTEEWAQQLGVCITESKVADEADGTCRCMEDIESEEEEIERDVQEFRKKMEGIFGITLEPTIALLDEQCEDLARQGKEQI